MIPVRAATPQLQLDCHHLTRHTWGKELHFVCSRYSSPKGLKICCNAGTPEDSLRLNPQVLAGIYTCKITSWQDPAIAALNPGLS